VPADVPVGRGDAFIVNELKAVAARTPVLGVVTKTDLARPEQVAERLGQLSELMEFAEIVPCSAVDGFQVQTVGRPARRAPPRRPAALPGRRAHRRAGGDAGRRADPGGGLEGVRDELPHSIAVTIDEMVPREDRDDLLDVHAVIHVERSSQKGIVIGKGGERLRQVGTDARRQIEALLGTRVYLDLHVKITKDWQRDPRQLRKLGF
jgi:GTP-binding protein Era